MQLHPTQTLGPPIFMLSRNNLAFFLKQELIWVEKDAKIPQNYSLGVFLFCSDSAPSLIQAISFATAFCSKMTKKQSQTAWSRTGRTSLWIAFFFHIFIKGSG